MYNEGTSVAYNLHTTLVRHYDFCSKCADNTPVMYNALVRLSNKSIKPINARINNNSVCTYVRTCTWTTRRKKMNSG